MCPRNKTGLHVLPCGLLPAVNLGMKSSTFYLLCCSGKGCCFCHGQPAPKKKAGCIHGVILGKLALALGRGACLSSCASLSSEQGPTYYVYSRASGPRCPKRAHLRGLSRVRPDHFLKAVLAATFHGCHVAWLLRIHAVESLEAVLH